MSASVEDRVLGVVVRERDVVALVGMMRKGLNKDASRSDYHTYCHADGWKKDVAYVNAVPHNFAKVRPRDGRAPL